MMYFLKYITKLVLKVTSQSLQVTAVFADFKDALCNAAVQAFPGVKVFGESFHFMQANLCWMAKQKQRDK